MAINEVKLNLNAPLNSNNKSGKLQKINLYCTRASAQVHSNIPLGKFQSKKINDAN